jgi:hypothetical protein
MRRIETWETAKVKLASLALQNADAIVSLMITMEVLIAADTEEKTIVVASHSSGH